MATQYDPPSHRLNCEIAVHGNGFLANVRTFRVSTSGCHQVGSETLKPGDAVRLEIAPEQGGRLTVQLGVVQWVDGDTVEVKITLMDMDEKQKLDEAAWSSVRGESKLFHWLRRSLSRENVQYINLSYVPRLCEESARLLVAA